MTSPSEFNHVMIDIETMSLNRHNALILSVGMIEFDPEPIEGLRIGSRSLLVPVVSEQLFLGREVTKSTQKWWADQSPEASEHWRAPNSRVLLHTMLSCIKSFCGGKDHVWANGNQFDLANLEGLADDLKFGDLWHYQAPRDMRTFCRVTSATRLLPTGYSEEGLIPHHPVDDSIRQAWGVWEHWSL
jgi:hypothetical protein